MNNLTFNKISINNFLSINKAEVVLSDSGFVKVSGINMTSDTDSSNGSGKSSIFDAIFWAITGETLRGASEIVNENHKSEGCLVSLTFLYNSNKYVVERTKSHVTKGNSCTVSCDDIIISDQTKKSQEYIESILPIVSVPEILGSIILLGQGLPYKFSSFSPTKRKDLLETMSGSTTEINKLKYRLDLIEDESKVKLNDLVSEKSKLEGSISGLQESVQIIRSQVDDYSSYDNSMKEISDLQNDSRLVNDQINEINSLLTQLDSQLTSAKDDYNKVSSYYQVVSTAKSSIISQLSSIKSGNCPTCGRPFDVSESSFQLKNLLETKLVSVNDQINQSYDKKLQAQREVSRLEEEIRNCNNQLSSLNYKISENSYKEESIRKTVDQINSLKSKVGEISDKIDLLKVEINRVEKDINAADKEVKCISYIKRQVSRDFKGYVLGEVIKFLSDRFNYYSCKLFNSAEKFRIELSGNKINICIGNRKYENLSGGERQRVDLAVQFSLRDMLTTTTDFSCNMLIIDEAFDNLDNNGSELLVNMLVSEFSDIDTMFVVTHRSEINVPYDQEIRVIKNKDGDSFVT